MFAEIFITLIEFGSSYVCLHICVCVCCVCGLKTRLNFTIFHDANALVESSQCDVRL